MIRFRRVRVFAVHLLLLLSIGPFPLLGQSQPRTISVKEAVDIALEQNGQIRQAENGLNLQESVTVQERAQFLPDLSFSVGSSQRYGLTFDQTTGELVSHSNQSMNAGASSRLNLFNGFADVASLKQSRRERSRAEHSYSQTRRQVVFDVLSQYLQVVLDKEQITIQEEALAAQERQLSQIEELVDAGARPSSDLYQQRANVAGRELELLNARQQLTVSKTQLVEILQLDPHGNYEFDVPSIEDPDLEPASFDLQELTRSAYEHRLELKAQEDRILALEQGIRVARSGYWPSINLSGQVGTGYTSNSPFAFVDQFSDNRNGSIGLSISVPIFDRLSTSTQVERMRVEYRNARLDREMLRQQISSEVRQSYLDYETAAKRLDVTEAQLAAAEQALEATQERYNVGTVSFSDLAASRADFVRATSDRTQAIYEFLFQEMLIDYRRGQFDPSSIRFP